MGTQPQAVEDGALPFKLLSTQAVFRGLAITLFTSAVPALFLVRFGPEALPLAFLLSSILVPLAVLAYTFFERFLPVGVLVVGATVTSSVLIGWSWLVSTGEARGWIAFFPMVMLPIPAAYTQRAANNQAELFYNERRQRSVLPRVLALSIVGFGLAGILGPVVIVITSGPVILGVSVLAAVLLTAATGLLVTNYAASFAVRPTPDVQTRVNRARLSELWADAFFRRILICRFLAAVGGTLIYYLFLDLLSQRFGGDAQSLSASEMITFLVVHEAVWQAGAIVLLLVIGRWLLMRFGLRTGLAIHPVAVGLSAMLLLVLYVRGGTSTQFLFVVVVAARTLDLVLRRVATSPAFDVIRQVLPHRLRPAATVAVTAGAVPFGGAAAGVSLLIATRLFNGGGGIVTVLILVVTGLWIVISARTIVGYGARLKHRLATPSLSELGIAVDTAESRQAAESMLESPEPSKVAAGLDLLGTVGGLPYDTALVRLLETSDDSDVLLHVIRRVAIERPDGAVPGLVAQLAGDGRPDVSVAAMSALIACEPYGGGTVVQPLLRSEDPAVRYGAVRALLQGAVLRHHDPAMSELDGLARSSSSADRAAAADIIGDTTPPGATELLRRLVSDGDPAVRSAAIDAVGRLGLSGYAPAMLAALDHPETRRAAAKTLAMFGNGAVPSAAEALDRGGMPQQRAVLMLGAFASVPTPGTTSLMAVNIQHENLAIRAAAISALVGNPHLDSPRLALPNKMERVLQPAIGAEATRSGDLFRAVDLVPSDPSFGALSRANTQLAESHLANVLALLAAKYREPRLRYVHRQISGGGVGAAAARDIVSSTAGERDQETVGLLLGQRISSGPGRAEGAGDLAEVIALCDDDWVTATAIHGLVMSQGNGDGGRMEIESIARPGGEIGRWERSVREWEATLPPPSLWRGQDSGPSRVLRRMNGKALPMAVIEKVAVLRSCAVFSGIDDRLVAEVAEISEQITLGPKELLGAAGGVSEAIYVVVDGLLERSVDGTVAARMSAGDTIDELSVFDTRPRTHDVRTVSAVELLRVDRSDLLHLLGQQPELASGVIAALATAAQDGAAKETAAQDGAAKETAAQDGAVKNTEAVDDPGGTQEVMDLRDEAIEPETENGSKLSSSADAP